MKLLRKLVLPCVAAIILIAEMSASAIFPGFSPNVDPSLIKSDTLPEEYDQDFRDGMPYGYFVVSDMASYSFGITRDTKGNIYTASFNTNRVTKIMPDFTGTISLSSPTVSYSLPCSGLYAIEIDNEGNIIYTTNGTGQVGIYNVKTEKSRIIMRDLARPNHVAVDRDNNIYVACETGEIYRYDRKTEETALIISSVGCLQSLLVTSDGIIYALTFGKNLSDTPLPGSSIDVGDLWQIYPDGSSEIVMDGKDIFIYRGRGLATDECGYIYLTGEANVWDNGNSAVIAKFNPETRTVEKLTSGTDYSTFITYGSDGRLYQNTARDDFVIAYSEKADRLFTEQDWSENGVKVITYGGSFTPSKNGNITITAGSKSFKGNISSESGRVYGWIRIPAEMLPELDCNWTGSNDGKYKTPKLSFKGDGRCELAAMVKRIHMRARSPMIDIYTPAEDFRDNPEAYLVYFEWTSDSAAKKGKNEFKLEENISPSKVLKPYSSASLDILDFSGSKAYAGVTDKITDVLDLSKGNAEAITGSDKISFFFKTENTDNNLKFSASADGKGLSIVLKPNGALIVCTEGKEVYRGFICYNILDSEWHSFLLQNNFGIYEFEIDGIKIPLDSVNSDAIQASVGIPSTTFWVEGNGMLYIKENGEITASKIEVKASEQKKTDPLPFVCLGTAVLVLAAAVTALITKKNNAKA